MFLPAEYVPHAWCALMLQRIKSLVPELFRGSYVYETVCLVRCSRVSLAHEAVFHTVCLLKRIWQCQHILKQAGLCCIRIG